MVVVTEPIDALSSALQHVDSQRNTILEVLQPRGPIHRAQVSMFRLVGAPSQIDAPPACSVGDLAGHFAGGDNGDEFKQDAFVDQWRGMVLNIAAQLWTRLELEYQHAWPWILFRLVDPTAPPGDKDRLAHEFFHAEVSSETP